MLSFKAEIERYESNGEKTGWSYVFIPSEIATKIKPNNKKSFRLKGLIDEIEIDGMATTPIGGGDFILALKLELRKKLNKGEGDFVSLSFAEDKDFKILMPKDLEICLLEEKHLIQQFLSMAESHQNYFINWINQAKTDITRTKRIAMTVTAMGKQQDYGTMIRESKRKV